MKTVLILVGVLTGVSGWATYCSPAQWEGFRLSVSSVYKNGKPLVDDSLTRIFYDYNHTQVALYTSGKLDGVRYNVTNIYDYSHKLLYTIHGNNCHKTPLNNKLNESCFSETQVVWRVTWFGGHSAQEVLWIIEVTGQVDKLNYYGTFSEFPYVPVLETLTGERNGVYQHSQYINVTLGIKDPSVFVPPPSCKGVPVQPSMDFVDTHRPFIFLKE